MRTVVGAHTDEVGEHGRQLTATDLFGFQRPTRQERPQADSMVNQAR